MQWWERSPPTNVTRVRFPDPASYVGWVCCWFPTLLREVFLPVLRFSPFLKNQHFQIPIRSGMHGHFWTSSCELLDVLWVNKLHLHFLLRSIVLGQILRYQNWSVGYLSGQDQVILPAQAYLLLFHKNFSRPSLLGQDGKMLTSIFFGSLCTLQAEPFVMVHMLCTYAFSIKQKEMKEAPFSAPGWSLWSSMQNLL